jgi:hypothetical protein
MANDNMPFVAIIGGFWMLKDPAVAEETKKRAREIGAALAKEGMGLVVYFSNDESLEPPCGVRLRGSASLGDRGWFDSSALRRITEKHGEVR